jgi:ribonucleoside-triphosphate reductase
MSSNQEKGIIPLTESEMFVRQSDESVDLFDPQRITDALARETNLASETAHEIALEVKEQIRLSGIRALTAPLIRGLVDAKLLERGLMDEYRLHSRLGVPLYDVDRVIQSVSGETGMSHGPEGSSLTLAEAIKREYAIRNIFSDAVSSAHLVGDLHIENLGEVDRPTTMIGSVDFIKRHGVRLPGGFAGSRPAKRAEVLVLHLVTYTAALQGYFSETLAWDSVNFSLAPMLVGLNQREIKQIAQGLLFELSSPAIARGGQPVRCDLHLDCEAPAYLRDLQIVGAGGEKFSSTYGQMEETARDFLKALFEVYLEGDGQGLPFTGPRPILHLNEGFIENPFNRGALDLVIRAATERGGVTLAFDRPGDNPASESFTARYGVGADRLQRVNESWQWRAATLSSVAINLPRVGYRAADDPQGVAKIFDLLTELLELAAQASLEKRIFLEKLLARGESGALAMLAMRPGQEIFLPLSWTAHAICPVGLAELAQIATGGPLDVSSSAQDFAASVIAHLNAEAERLSVKHKVRFMLAESRDAAAPHRLARLDLKFANHTSGQINPGGESAAEIFYTNSVKLPVNSGVDAFDRIRIESELQGGMIRNAVTDLWLGAALPQTEKFVDLISRTFHNTQASAIAFSPDFSVCDVCHIVMRGLLSNCPQCGSMRVDGLAQGPSRYSRTSTWPQWKLAELDLRKREEI